jgi:hypothetical protein
MRRKLSSITALAILTWLSACGAQSPRTDDVKAGFFDKVGYDPGPRLLTVYFKDGSVYGYEKVPEKVYLDLIKSHSPGSFYNDEIKGTYTSELVHIRTKPYAPPRLTPKEAEPVPSFLCAVPSPANRKALKSVILDYAAYDAPDKCMVLYFDRGYTYEYGNVPAAVFNELVHSKDVDRFFNKDIWGKYPKRQTQKP